MATIIISALIVAALVGAVTYTHKKHKAGGCVGCSQSGGCSCCGSDSAKKAVK